MNMQTNTLTKTNELGFDSFISQEMTLIEENAKRHEVSLSNYAKAFLDKSFPLAQGSHKDVVSYVVYYHHLLVFFENGAQSGLVEPKQFVGLCGHKEEPEAILLRANDRHVEVTFSKTGDIGKKDKAHVDDVQIETVDDGTTNKKRVWFSMIKDNRELRLDKEGKAKFSCRDEIKCFTAKDGSAVEL